MKSERARVSRVVVGGVAVVALGVLLYSSFALVRGAGAARQPPAADAPIPPARVRQPAVAGQFYPEEPQALVAAIDGHLARVPRAVAAPIPKLRALIVPHAGYRFSGPTAAIGFHQLRGRPFDTVFVLGPSHHVRFGGVAVPDADAFRTPLGLCRLDPVVRELRGLSPFTLLDAPQATEHSVEVQVPFLQRVLGSFALVPLVFGYGDPRAVADALQPRLGPRSVLIVSSDLSHYHPYAEAQRLDRAFVAAVESLDLAGVAAGEACGKLPVLTLVHLARRAGWQAKGLDYRNSGDTTGARDKVVGYAAIAFYEAP